MWTKNTTVYARALKMGVCGANRAEGCNRKWRGSRLSTPSKNSNTTIGDITMPDMFYSVGYCSDDDYHDNEIQGNQADMAMNTAPRIPSTLEQNKKLCNRCLSVLKLRSGKFGDFLFCENQKTCGAKTISIK